MCPLIGQRRCALRRRCDAADTGLSSECFNWGGFELPCYHPQSFVLTTLQLLGAGRGGPRLPRRSRVDKEAEQQGFLDFHQLVLSPPPRLRRERGEHSASGSRLCRDVLDVWTEGQQPVQCDSEEFRLKVVMKAGVVGDDCGLSVRLMGVCGEECHFAFIGVEDHFLKVSPFGNGGVRTP